MVENKDNVVDLVLKQKLEERKQHKRQIAKRRTIKISVIVLIIVFGFLYWSSNISKPKVISVSGNYVLSKDEIVKATDISLDTNLIIANPFLIKQRLLKHPLINDANISWSLFGRYININIKEVDVFAYRQKSDSATMLMLNGEHVELSSDFYKFMPNLIFLEGFEEPTIETRLIESFQNLDRDVINQISEIHHTEVSFDKNYIMIRMNDGNKVYTSFQTVGQLNFYFDIITNLKASNTCIIIDEMSGEAYSQPCEDVQVSE